MGSEEKTSKKKTGCVRAMTVRYERLVHEPDAVMGEVCAFIGVEYNPDILRFHEKPMSLFESPHGHLSHKQIAQGLNASSIGRWRHDLPAAEVETFAGIAGGLLRELGYV